VNPQKYLYLSLIPEALIASMLTPEEFGSYYAIGAQFNAQGEAIFFEVDPNFRSDDFPFDVVDERCVADADGRPKETVYLSIYRVLERMPVSALGSLFLTTDDGRTLELKRCEYEPETEQALRLYQEVCPVSPMVGSRLEPKDFCRFMTNPESPVHVPRIVFSELIVQGLRTDPENGTVDDLPYPWLAHLRDVLKELQLEEKASKMVLRQVKQDLLYRTVRSGFFVGDQHDFAFYRFPTVDELERDHHAWWRSAQTTSQL
jgi:hypothetical protein